MTTGHTMSIEQSELQLATRLTQLETVVAELKTDLDTIQRHLGIEVDWDPLEPEGWEKDLDSIDESDVAVADTQQTPNWEQEVAYDLNNALELSDKPNTAYDSLPSDTEPKT